MRIVAARITPVRLPLRAPLPTARGPIAAREGFLLALESDGGAVGYGEALPLAAFRMETRAAAGRALEALARALCGAGDALEPLLDQVERLTLAEPAARAAADCALHDLDARDAGESLAARLAAPAPPRARVAVNALIRHAEPAAAADAARRAVGKGYHCLKLKLVAAHPVDDETRVAAVRAAVGREIALRLDANGAWSERGARVRLERLARFRIEHVEQPVPAADLDALARVRSGSPIAIAADEAVAGPGSVEAILARRAADVLVLKPAALGGLRAAWRAATRARRAGVRVVVTSMVDGAVGRGMGLALAAALPEPQPPAGLATGSLLLRDLGRSPQPKDGGLDVPAAAGLGIAPEASLLRHVSTADTWTCRA